LSGLLLLPSASSTASCSPSSPSQDLVSPALFSLPSVCYQAVPQSFSSLLLLHCRCCCPWRCSLSSSLGSVGQLWPTSSCFCCPLCCNK
ncbi:hypothetical protein CLOM_g1586, partial [Closterium sp. NIES-68]